MKLKHLDTKHPEHQAETWRDLWALYLGGDEFRARIERFLPRNPMEHEEQYEWRKRNARYRSYIGQVVDYLVGALFEQNFSAAPSDGGDAGEFYAAWRDDCDGKGTDLGDFLRERMVRAMCAPRSFWLCEMPDVGAVPNGATLSDWRAAGGDQVRLCGVNAEDVYDWTRGPDGRINWAVIHSRECERRGLASGRDLVTERWTVLDDQQVEVYAVTYKRADGRPKEDAEVALESSRPHGFARCPLFALEFAPGMRLVPRLADAQLSHFSTDAALGHTLRMTAYAMPVVQLANVADSPKRMGAGYFLTLPLDAKYGFLEPEGSAASLLHQRCESDRQEIFRLAHQASMGTDANSAASIGRSAQSKAADAKVTNTMLDAWGSTLREAIKATYDFVAEARQEPAEWVVEGLSNFEAIDLEVLLEVARGPSATSMPSPTFKRELSKRISRAVLPDASSKTQDAIDRELDTNIIDEQPSLEQAEALLRAELARSPQAEPPQ